MAKTLNKWLDEFVESGANPNNVTDWPEDAGSGSGSKIVDALPADGVEGQTYLLRHTTEILPMRFKCYTWVYSNDSHTDTGHYFIVTDDYTSEQIENAFLEKIGYNTPAKPYLSLCSVWTEAEFEESFNQNVVYVSNEEQFINADLSNNPEVLQYHGIIGLEDLIFVQSVDLGNNIHFAGRKNDLLTQTTITDNQITYSSRQAISNDDHGQFNSWSSETATLAETLTDAYEGDPEFWQEHQNEAVKINITGQTEYEYSYTEYVFDHGVYTEISAKSAGASTKKAVAYINDGYPFSITFECDDTSISTYADLLNYLKTKGYSGIDATSDRPFPTLICSCIGGSYALDDSSITCIYATIAIDWETGQTFEAIGVSNGLNNSHLSLDTSITISFLN